MNRRKPAIAPIRLKAILAPPALPDTASNTPRPKVQSTPIEPARPSIPSIKLNALITNMIPTTLNMILDVYKRQG